LAGRKPSLGQNFLSDDAAIARIVDALGDLRDRLVLEIGPGHGALTHLLAQRAASVVAIELDRTLAPFLQARYSGNAAVHVLQQDILTTDLREIVQQYSPGNSKALLVGNLPYYITSDILLHLVDHADALDAAVIMVQREVAQRVAAQPGSREYGLLSATMQMFARVEDLFTLPPQSFSPAPTVHSTVLRLTMQPRYAELGVERKPFEDFLRKIFAQKRKTLSRNLRNAGFDADRIAAAMAEAGLETNIRAEACSLGATAALYRALMR
jgi:16S rRNA (adenine1518-N6/adenine1519-N6)-dimethyltransferase